MAGLLDDLLGNLNSDQGLLGLAMLSAAAPRERRTTLGEGLMSGLNLVNQRKLQREEQAMRQAEMRMREQDFGLRQKQAGLQEQQILQALEAQKRAQEQAQQRQRYLGSVDPMQGPAMPVSMAGGMAAGLSPQEAAALMPPQQKAPEYKVVNGSLVKIAGDNVSEAFRAPEKPEAAPTSVREFTYAKDNPQFAAWLREQANLKAPKAPVVNLFNNDQSKAETELRKEFADLPQVKRFNSAIPAYKAIEDAAKRNTTQADINLVYGIAKLYDPESVVREGEYATIANSQSIPEKVKGIAQYLAGGGRLTPETKNQLLIEARGRIGAFKQEHDAARETYTGVATRRSLDPQNIFIGPADIKPPDTSGGDLAAAARAELERRRNGGR